MKYLNKRIIIIFFVFSVSPISIAAQEINLFNDMLKETLKIELSEMIIPIETDPNFYNEFKSDIIIDEYMYRSLLVKRNDFALSNKNLLFNKNETPYLSIRLTATHLNYNIDNGKFNGNGKFSGEFATRGDILMSKATYGSVNVSGLFFLITSKIGVNYNPKKESKKEKMLRIIKILYCID